MRRGMKIPQFDRLHQSLPFKAPCRCALLLVRHLLADPAPGQTATMPPRPIFTPWVTVAPNFAITVAQNGTSPPSGTTSFAVPVGSPLVGLAFGVVLGSSPPEITSGRPSLAEFLAPIGLVAPICSPGTIPSAASTSSEQPQPRWPRNSV